MPANILSTRRSSSMPKHATMIIPEVVLRAIAVQTLHAGLISDRARPGKSSTAMPHGSALPTVRTIRLMPATPSERPICPTMRDQLKIPVCVSKNFTVQKGAASENSRIHFYNNNLTLWHEFCISLTTGIDIWLFITHQADVFVEVADIHPQLSGSR